MKLRKESEIERLNISFSGGRSSAYMTKLLVDKFRNTNVQIVVTFANTGCEHLDTLRFVNACDIAWNLNVVWLEAEVHSEKGIGITHKIVNYESASRNGEPFENVIKKYGIPNTTNPHCTGRLKVDVMEDYLKSIGFVRGVKLNYHTAIGIRADECDRMSVNADKMKFIYPLIDLGISKQDVINFMSNFNFDLRIPEHLGNCTWCWKKNLRKHLTLAQDYPEVFEFPKKMDEKYGQHMANCKAGDGDGNRRFFRKHLTTDQILEMSKEEFVRFDDPNFNILTHWSEDLDLQSSCEQSCEVYPH